MIINQWWCTWWGTWMYTGVQWLIWCKFHRDHLYQTFKNKMKQHYNKMEQHHRFREFCPVFGRTLHNAAPLFIQIKQRTRIHLFSFSWGAQSFFLSEKSGKRCRTEGESKIYNKTSHKPRTGKHVYVPQIRYSKNLSEYWLLPPSL